MQRVLDGRFGCMMDALFIFFILFLLLLMGAAIAALYGIVLGIYEHFRKDDDEEEIETDKTQKK